MNEQAEATLLLKSTRQVLSVLADDKAEVLAQLAEGIEPTALKVRLARIRQLRTAIIRQHKYSPP